MTRQEIKAAILAGRPVPGADQKVYIEVLNECLREQGERATPQLRELVESSARARVYAALTGTPVVLGEAASEPRSTLKDDLRPPDDPVSRRSAFDVAVEEAAARVRATHDADMVARRARDLDGAPRVLRPAATLTLREERALTESLPEGIHGLVANLLPNRGAR